jgi:hypothetical protein
MLDGVGRSRCSRLTIATHSMPIFLFTGGRHHGARHHESATAQAACQAHHPTVRKASRKLDTSYMTANGVF